jgi:hypothetical protein
VEKGNMKRAVFLEPQAHAEARLRTAGLLHMGGSLLRREGGLISVPEQQE